MFPIYHKESEFVQPNDPIYYLLASNGLYLIKKNLFFTSSIPVFEPQNDKKLGWLEPHKMSVFIHLPKRISNEQYQTLAEFFRQIAYKHAGSEAVVLVYWDKAAEEYIFRVTDQYVGAGTALYKIGPNPTDFLKVGSFHSHGFASAYHSTTDDNDEAHDDGVHTTLGNVNFIPTISCSIVVDGLRFDVKPEYVIDTGLTGAHVPDDWFETVRKIPPKKLPKKGARTQPQPAPGFNQKRGV